MSKKILITGGTGFAGSHLLEFLAQTEPQSDIHVTSFHTQNPFVSEYFPQVTQHELDLTNQQAVFDLFATLQLDEIYHLASLAVVGSSFDQVHQILTNNISLHLHVLEALKRHTPQARLLSVGTAEVYGATTLSPLTPMSEETLPRPTNPYSISKLTQELLSLSYARSYGLHIICARPFNHLGERQTAQFVVPAFASQIAHIEKGRQNVLKIGNVDTIRDFSDAKDIVKGYALLMQKGVAGEVYNLGSGQGVKIQDILDFLVSMASVPITIEKDPSRSRPSETPWLVANTDKIQALGWQPSVQLKETLTRIMIYQRSLV